MRQKQIRLPNLKNSSISFLPIFISIIGLIISIWSFNSSKEANEISKSANKIAKDSNVIADRSLEIAESSSTFEKKQRSSEIIDQQFNSIYDNEELNKTMETIINTDDNVDKKYLGRIIDVTENLGSKYCNGIIYKDHIRVSFSNTLNYLCNNDQVFNLFNRRKNGTAILCYIFIPDSKFAGTLIESSLKMCVPM